MEEVPAFLNMNRITSDYKHWPRGAVVFLFGMRDGTEKTIRIVAPGNAPSDAGVIVPLATDVATNIANRLGQPYGSRYAATEDSP